MKFSSFLTVNKPHEKTNRVSCWQVVYYPCISFLCDTELQGCPETTARWKRSRWNICVVISTKVKEAPLRFGCAAPVLFFISTLFTTSKPTCTVLLPQRLRSHPIWSDSDPMFHPWTNQIRCSPVRNDSVLRARFNMCTEFPQIYKWWQTEWKKT